MAEKEYEEIVKDIRRQTRNAIAAILVAAILAIGGLMFQSYNSSIKTEQRLMVIEKQLDVMHKDIESNKSDKLDKASFDAMWVDLNTKLTSMNDKLFYINDKLNKR